MVPANDMVQVLAASEKVSIDDLQKNATSKQYNMVITFKVTEANGDKPFYDANSNWSGVQYAIVIATEQLMIELLQKFQQLGATIATGGQAPAPK